MVKKLLTSIMATSIVFNIGAVSGSAQAKPDEHLFSKNQFLLLMSLATSKGITMTLSMCFMIWNK